MRLPGAFSSGLASLLLGLTGCGSASHGYELDVGGDDGGGMLSLQSMDAATSTLDVQIEDNGLTVRLITLSCSGTCANLVAIASGGNAPYAFTWSDGTPGAERRVCPTGSTTYQVTVKDTATTGEVARPSQTASASVAADVLPCLEAGVAPGVEASAGDATSGCTGSAGIIDSGTSLPQLLTIDVKGSTRYFNGGATLPAGNYRIAYVDGCMEWGAESLGYFWTVSDPQVMLGQGATALTDPGDCLLVANGSTVVGVLPGARGAGTASYAACVTTSKASTPLAFTFAGGTLGIFVNDGIASDDIGGEGQCGASPTWQLSAQ